jgi:hypothetical protein
MNAPPPSSGHIHITRHARRKFRRLHKALFFGSAKPDKLHRLMSSATREKPRGRTRFELFRRSMLHGDTKFLVSNGWRMVLRGNTLVTVERILPHENIGKAPGTFTPRRRRRRNLARYGFPRPKRRKDRLSPKGGPQ